MGREGKMTKQSLCFTFLRLMCAVGLALCLIAVPANLATARGRSGPAEGTFQQESPYSFTIETDGPVTEDDSGPQAMLFTVTISPAATEQVTVQYATSDGSAKAEEDYQSTTGDLTFDTGDTQKIITVLVNDDQLDEDDETLNVLIKDAANSTLASAEGTITDNDEPPTVSITSPSVPEGGGSAAFVVSLSTASGKPVSMNYATEDGSAAAEGDYQSQSGSLTFEPGDTEQTISVPVHNDTLDEDNETFNVVLSTTGGAYIDTGVGTITDNDEPPTVSITSPSVPEGGGSAAFVVSLSAASGKTISMHYATEDGSAAAEGDYQSKSGSLTFDPGDTHHTININIIDDLVDESDETFALHLTDISNAANTSATGTGTITDNDTAQFTISNASLTEGDTSQHNATFTVLLSTASSTAVTVHYATSDGSAEAGSDYQSTSGDLTFNPGITQQTIDVPVFGDTLDEDNETFDVVLSTTGGAYIDTGVGTITDNDEPPTVSITSPSVPEGGGSAAFVVSLSAASGKTISMHYATEDGSAAAEGDYQSKSGSLTFDPGDTHHTININIIDDLVDESDETFALHLTDISNAANTSATGTGTITDNDTAQFTISNASLTEGDTSQHNATFTVLLSTASSTAVTVHYATSDDSAEAGSDYQSTSGDLTFNPGVTQRTINVPVLGDLVDEDTETFNVTLSDSADITIADATGVGTILDNDNEPSISISDASVQEGNSGTVAAEFIVTLSATSSKPVTVNYATENGSAMAGLDYQAHLETLLTFNPGVTHIAVTINVIGDVIDEANETFSINLSDATNATIADVAGTGTILDDDTAQLSITDASITEGDSGSQSADFTVTLSTPSSSVVTVAYATTADTATAGTDYQTASGSLSFAAGEIRKVINVPVLGDLLDEDDETFNVTLSTPSGASIADAMGVGTIVDNDSPPSLSITNQSVQEGDSGTVAAVFSVSLNAVSGRTVTVNYATEDGTATAGLDYQARTSTTLTFAPGVTQVNVTVNVIGDVIDEANETFSVNLSNPTNATIADATGTGTIQDNDTAQLSITDVSFVEGNYTQQNAVFTVTLSMPSSFVVTVAYSTTAGTATSGIDFQGTAGTLSFSPGEVKKGINVPVFGDLTDEYNETLSMVLSNAVNASFSKSVGTATIVDDDALPSLSINNIYIPEPTSGTYQAVFAVSLTPASGKTVTVTYATAAGTATAGLDYQVASGMLTFTPGVIQQPITVTVNSDKSDEHDETFFVNLQKAGGALISTGSGRGTIIDLDPLPTISVTDGTVVEGNTGTASMLFTATLNTTSDRTVSVDLSAAGGTATAGLDYQAPSGTVTFYPGDSKKVIAVSIIGDEMDEYNETFNLNLVNPQYVYLQDGVGVGVIQDDDAPPTLNIANQEVQEQDSTVNAVFTVTLEAPSGKTVSVNYYTIGNTATAGLDFETQSDMQLSLAAGELTKTLTVPIIGDQIDEFDEMFDVVLSSPQNGVIGDGTGTGTIYDDDDPPNLSLADGSVIEGDDGTVSLALTVTLDLPSGKTIRVDFTTADGTAVAGADYVSQQSGQVSIAAGVVKQSLHVVVNGDTLDEVDETLSVSLNNPHNAGITDATGTGTILDNDAPPGITVVPAIALFEGDTGPVNAVFTLTLAAVSSKTAAVHVATEDGTATGGNPMEGEVDYQSISEQVVFAPGELVKTVQVPLNPDDVCETPEIFYLNLSGAENVTLVGVRAQATIKGDDICGIFLPVAFNKFIYADYFGSAGGWEEIPETNADWFLSRDEYHGRHLGKDRNAKTIAPIAASQLKGSYAVKVTLRAETGSDDGGRGGLLFDYMNNNATYRFVIMPGATGGENWFVQVRNSNFSRWDTLGSGLDTSHINPGNGVNVLRVERVDAAIRAYANGYLLWEGINSTYTNGQVGLNVGTPADLAGSEFVDFSFDNFMVGSLP